MRKVATIYAKAKDGTVAKIVLNLEERDDGTIVLMSSTQSAEALNHGTYDPLNFSLDALKLLAGWKQVGQPEYDKYVAAQDAKAADLRGLVAAEMAANVAAAAERKQALVDAILSLGKDDPAFKKLAELYS